MLDMDARYSVDGYRGIAFYLVGYAIRQHPGEYYDEEMGEVCWLEEPTYDDSLVRVVMVGDDREHIVDVDDLTPLNDDDYCSVCGQIGCTHDGR